MSCLGDLCPLGDCEPFPIAGLPACSGVYTEMLDAGFEFCAGTANGGYCLSAGATLSCDYSWAITCSDGAASFELCSPEGNCSVATPGEGFDPVAHCQ